MSDLNRILAPNGGTDAQEQMFANAREEVRKLRIGVDLHTTNLVRALNDIRYALGLKEDDMHERVLEKIRELKMQTSEGERG